MFLAYVLIDSVLVTVMYALLDLTSVRSKYEKAIYIFYTIYLCVHIRGSS